MNDSAIHSRHNVHHCLTRLIMNILTGAELGHILANQWACGGWQCFKYWWWWWWYLQPGSKYHPFNQLPFSCKITMLNKGQKWFCWMLWCHSEVDLWPISPLIISTRMTLSLSLGWTQVDICAKCVFSIIEISCSQEDRWRNPENKSLSAWMSPALRYKNIEIEVMLGKWRSVRSCFHYLATTTIESVNFKFTVLDLNTCF